MRAHEIADAGRERRIEERLRQDQMLRDPLIVGSVVGVEPYVLLDGTNRRQALTALGLPHALVQVIDYADEHAVQLRSWCHAAAVGLEALAAGVAAVPGMQVVPLAPLEASERLRTVGTVAVLLAPGRQLALVRDSDSAIARTEQLRALVALYEAGMTRVDCDPERVEEQADTLEPGVTLIAYPSFTRSQVISMALRDLRIPAGITRHVITGGRALRVNVPLELLSDRYRLDEANDALQAHVARLHPRHYREPTVLFDS